MMLNLLVLLFMFALLALTVVGPLLFIAALLILFLRPQEDAMPEAG